MSEIARSLDRCIFDYTRKSPIFYTVCPLEGKSFLLYFLAIFGKVTLSDFSSFSGPVILKLYCDFIVPFPIY